MLSVDLTSVEFDKNANCFLPQTLSDYDNRTAFFPWELRQKRLTCSTLQCDGKVFIKIKDNGNKGKIKHFIQLTRKFSDLIFSFDDWYSLILLRFICNRWIEISIKRFCGLFICENVSMEGSIINVSRGTELAFGAFFNGNFIRSRDSFQEVNFSFRI